MQLRTANVAPYSGQDIAKERAATIEATRGVLSARTGGGFHTSQVFYVCLKVQDRAYASFLQAVPISAVIQAY
jgi:hypothetical protein